jgi:hypothetical protein
LASTEQTVRTHLSPEGRLLLATAGGPAMNDTIRSLAGSIADWTAMLQLLVQERAEAVVSARFTELGLTLPDSVTKELRVMAMRSDLRMARMSRRLEETVNAFAAAGIPVLLLKGAALGRTVYGIMPRRPMLDLDLLIPSDQRAEAKRVALAHGWQPSELEGLEDFYSGHYHMAPLHDANGHFNLEIHTALLVNGHPFTWPVAQVWEESTALPDMPARVPVPEQLLLHIGIHFSWSHLGRTGAWRAFRDVQALAASGTLDWTRFLALAQRARATAACYWTLHLAQQLAGVEVPPVVLETLRPPMPGAVNTALVRHFASHWYPGTGPTLPLSLDQGLWRVAMRPGWSGHQGVLPWTRDLIFDDPRAPRQADPLAQRWLRLLTNPFRYARYLHHISGGR